MSTLLALGLANAACAAILAIPAYLVGRYGRRPALAHALWLLVLLKLVTPPLFHLSLPWLPPEPAPAQTPAPTANLTFVVEQAPFAFTAQVKGVPAPPPTVFARIARAEPPPRVAAPVAPSPAE